MEAVWKFFLNKKSFSFLVVTALLIAGLISVISIPKESAPEVQIPVAVITTVFPGAAPEDVEKLVTDKVEEQLKNSLTELDNLTSSSREGISVVVAEFNATADIDKSIQETEDEVDKIRPSLPTEAEDPVVTDVNFADQPIMLISIASDLAFTEFISLAEKVVDELKTIPGVSRVEKSGIRERQAQVVVNKEALSNFGISITDVIRAISTSNNSVPVGSITQENVEYRIRFEGNILDPAEIEDIAVLSVSNTPVFVRDVATVYDGVSDALTFSRLSTNGELSQQSLSLSVFKKRGGDITKTTKGVRDKLNELQKTSLSGANVSISYDVGEFVQEDLTRLSFTGLQTVILVMFILFITIGWRESLIAGTAIPLSFLISFIGLNNSGNTINFVSLFSLILAVGILVDSAIVITEGVHTRIRAGTDKKSAAEKTIDEFHLPVTSGTMTTIAVFFPLFFISGITGKFIATIPFTIIFVLLSSLIVALAFVPLLASTFLKTQQSGKMQEKQEIYIQKLKAWYRTKMLWFLGAKKRENWFMVSIVLLLIASLALPATGIVKVIFFPEEDQEFVFLEFEKPEGTTLFQTDLAAREIEEILYQEKNVESFVTTVGGSSAFGGNPSGGSRLGNINIALKKNREQTSFEVVDNLRKQMAKVKNVEISVFVPSSGPPVGDPVLIRFLGDDFDKLDRTALLAQDTLKSIPGTTEVQSSAQSGTVDIVLTVDRAKASELGLNITNIGQILRSAIHGVTATTIKNQDNDIDVTVKLALNSDYIDPTDTNRTNIDSIRLIEIQTNNGSVLLGSVLSASAEKGNAVINHEDRKRVVSVSSQLIEGAIASDVLTAFQEKITENGIPEGVEMKIGGESEEVQQSFTDMFYALIFGMLLVLSILVLQFNSFREAFFIIIIVPFTLIGIFLGLAITGKSLSFPALMGFIALAGIVVNNSIILIDVMKNLRKTYPAMPILEVVLEGASSRLRPILLTTLTTVIGIFPLTYASGLWSPLAYAIMFGLTFAVVLTLILVPILYHRWPGKQPT
ncbi:MAG: efflux RND transporter permease subunit [bacterium]|nr:efflux RND transporter permease subunit [bacterium]